MSENRLSVTEIEDYLRKYMNTQKDFYLEQGLTLQYFQSALKQMRVGHKPINGDKKTEQNAKAYFHVLNKIERGDYDKRK